MSNGRFPGGARFAFTIIDDTDVATVANVAPIYRLLERLGMRTTKTVWPLEYSEGSSDYAGSQTLADAEYVAFIRDLRTRGFEITWHGATMESSTRERTLRGLSRYREVLGEYPRIHVNHSYNRENIYWGSARVDDRALKVFAERFGDRDAGYYLGDQPGSDYWWGDVCREHFEYARNLTFSDINVSAVNPTMPYRDPSRPLVPWWFSSADADNVLEFNELLRSAQQQRLEAEGGICIVATHLGKGFVEDGRVNATTAELLTELSRRRGWFPTVGTLLDWLRANGSSGTLPRTEWRRMQWRWFKDLVLRRIRSRLRGSWHQAA